MIGLLVAAYIFLWPVFLIILSVVLVAYVKRTALLPTVAALVALISGSAVPLILDVRGSGFHDLSMASLTVYPVAIVCLLGALAGRSLLI